MDTSLQMRMLHQRAALEYLLSGINEESAKQRPLADKWSIAENIAHLGRYHEVFLERMERVLAEDAPLFERYVADNDSEFIKWSAFDLQHMLQSFHMSRNKLNDFLFELTDEQLKKTGRHPVFGAMNINAWTEFFLLHEAHHYFTIFRLLPQITVAQK